MPLPLVNPCPPFQITRAGHTVLTCRDLDATRAFYVDMLGLVLTEQTSTHLYLRALEERFHHSVVFVKSDGPPSCRRIGFRVFSNDDLKRAEQYFGLGGRDCRFVEVEHQGLTLHVDDPVGTPLELCATMTQVGDKLRNYVEYRGGMMTRFDHWQVVSPNVQASADWYASLGFRVAEYTAQEGAEQLWGAWMHRKGNPHDIAITNGNGPRLHHFAYSTPEIHSVIHLCDRLGSVHQEGRIDRGPGRHGISNALYVYMRDPDDHRIEVFNCHYSTIDIDHQPLRWDTKDPRRSQLWGPPPQKRWWFEATPFEGRAVVEPNLDAAVTTDDDNLNHKLN